MSNQSGFTPEAREASKEARREAKRRRGDLATLSVEALLADQTPGTRVPSWAAAHLDRARRGSLSGAIAAKCAECTCFQREEIRACEVRAWPLWAFRPY